MNDKKPLNIGIIIDVYNEKISNGGAVSTRRFVEELRKKHNVTVISTGLEEPGKISLPNFPLPIYRHVMERNGFRFAWPDDKTLRAILGKMDIVHIEFPFLLGAGAVRVSNSLDVPVISSFHVQPENILFNIGIRSGILTSQLYSLFIKTVYNKTKAVVCPSRFAESELKQHGLTVPTYIVSNGIVPVFRPMAFQRSSRLNGRFVILSVGRLSKEKHQELLIEGVARSKYRDRIQLIFSGQGPLKDKLVRQGAGLPLKPHFLKTNLSQLVYLYNIADLYVHASEVELESMTVLEAIGCGLPPLISDSRTSAARQFALDDRFLFSAGDPASLASKIDYWVKNEAGLREAGERYHRLVSKYKIKKSVEELENIYYTYAR